MMNKQSQRVVRLAVVGAYERAGGAQSSFARAGFLAKHAAARVGDETLFLKRPGLFDVPAAQIIIT